MATTTIKKGQPGSRAWFRDSFVLHKLHSLSGVLPIGAFMIQHLLANSYSLRGERDFNTVAKVIGYFPFVAILEIAVIFVPILFHSIYGFFITAEMRSNVGVYQFGRNWLYWLQRVSGIVAFFYIAFHVYSTTILRRMFEFGAYDLRGAVEAHDAGFRAISYAAMQWRFADWWYLAIYILGITMAAFHLANGLFNFCIRWGLTIGASAQKISAVVWSGLGLGLALIGIATAVNFHVQSQDFRGKGPIRAQYATLLDLVRSQDAEAPAAPVPGAKPTAGDTAPPGSEGQH